MIYIQTLDRYWDPGKKMLEGQTKVVKNSFHEYLAYEFVNEVKRAIDTQKYKKKWKPLSPQYLAYKRRKGLSPIIWQATKQLKSSLKVSQSKGVYTIGWDKRIRHNKSKIPLYRLAKYMEFGTIKMPPRPLFRFILDNMSKNISRYWKKFSKWLFGDNPTNHRFTQDIRRKFKSHIRQSYLSIVNALKLFRRR